MQLSQQLDNGLPRFHSLKFILVCIIPEIRQKTPKVCHSFTIKKCRVLQLVGDFGP